MKTENTKIYTIAFCNQILKCDRHMHTFSAKT